MYLLISSMQSLNHFWKTYAASYTDILHNYRPVSNLPFVSKLVEKVVAKQISTHIDKKYFARPFSICLSSRPLYRNSATPCQKWHPRGTGQKMYNNPRGAWFVVRISFDSTWALTHHRQGACVAAIVHQRTVSESGSGKRRVGWFNLDVWRPTRVGVGPYIVLHVHQTYRRCCR